MRIGIAQINTVAGAFSQTVERMVAQSVRAAEQGVDLLVFPLAALAGVDVVPYADRLSYLHDVSDALTALSERLRCRALVPVPVDLGFSDSYYDAVLIDQGEVRQLRGESLDGFRGGRPLASPVVEMPTFEVAGSKLVLALSHDDLDELCAYDYEVDAVVFISGYPFAMDDPSSAMGADLTHGRYVPDAETMGSWLVGVAPVGGYGDQVFAGASFVLDGSGELVASAPAFEEALLVADIGAPAGEPHPAAFALESFDSPFFLWQAVSMGIHDYVTKQGYHDVALGLDGTLASMVLAALATDALGPTHVHVLIGLQAGSAAPACRELARRMRVSHVDATGPVASFAARDLDELQLAALAREQDALVLSPLDKTALALTPQTGTLTSAALCPLGDVYRSDVLDMAHVRNTISPLFRKVTLGARDAVELRMTDGSVRTFEGEHEITALDEILLGYIEYDRPLADLAQESDEQAALADACLRAWRCSEPLRRALPPVLGMSTRTLDDARFPLGMSWQDTHFELSDGLVTVGMIPQEEVLPDQEDEASETPETPHTADIEGTLAMLRDLAEQGGFAPQGMSLPHEGEFGDAWRHQHGAQDLGWMTPFSEN